jgi:hypothetical protein
MKNQITRLSTITVLAATLAGLAACCTSRDGEGGKGHGKNRPVIIVQPEDAVVKVGEVATFQIVAEPSNQIKYQWLFNGTNLYNDGAISGATNATLTINPVAISNVGFYQCALTFKNAMNTSKSGVLYAYTTSNLVTAVSGPFTSSMATKSCIGSYIGYAKFKDPATGSYWWSRPTGTTHCTITDTTGSSCSIKLEAVESTSLNSWCGPSPLTFPTQAPPTYRYNLTTYIISCPGTPPSTWTLSVNWF